MTHYLVTCEKRVDSEWYTESQEITHDLQIARKTVASMVVNFRKGHSEWSVKYNTPDSFRAESPCGRFSTCFFASAIREIELEHDDKRQI